MWRLAAHGTQPGDPHGVLVIWSLFQRLTNHMWHLMAIPNAPHDFLRIRVIPYRGRPLILPDGTTIRSGTPVAELHVNNDAILRFQSRREMSLVSASRQDFRCLSKWLADADPGHEVKALFGITLLGPLAARLGFVRVDHNAPIKKRLDRMFMHGLLMLYSVEGLRRMSRGLHLQDFPQEIWMSRHELMRRYGDAVPRGEAPKPAPAA
jgi:peptidoglycan-N-acetylglucosamine deacetylase